MSNVVENIISKFSGKSIMDGIEKNQLIEFTQRYYGLIVLSGRKVEKDYKNIRIDSFPYINDKKTKESLSKKYKEYATTEDILLYFRASENQELYISQRGIYFKMFDVMEEEHISGFVPFENISSLEVVQKGDYFCLECNGVLLITDDVKNKDFYEDIDLKEYIKHILENNLTISEDEMVEGTKRHININSYQKIQKIVKQRKIVGVALEQDDFNHGYYGIVVFTPEHYFTGRNINELYDIPTKFNEKCYCIGNDCYGIDSGLTYLYVNERQMDAVIQYMNELAAEKEKEKAVEADIQNQVEKLVKLKTIGLITEEEFDEKRKALLERMGL